MKPIENLEYKNFFPRPNTEDFKALKKSIKEMGQQIPITLNSRGVILDGYSRFSACRELGIEPKTEAKRFKDKYAEIRFINDVNKARRHLNDFQKVELKMRDYFKL